MLFPTKRFFDEHHFWDTSIHTVSFVSPFESLQDIVKHTSFQIVNGLDVSAHSQKIDSALPTFQPNYRSKQVIARWIDGFFFYDTKNMLHKSALLLRTADCAPVTFASKNNDCFWIVHIGWKWLVSWIIESTGKELQVLKKDIKDFDIWIWPMAGEGFEFWKDDFENKIRPYIQDNWLNVDLEEFWDKIRFDLRDLVVAWLKKEWFENISHSKLNTLDKDKNLPSWRKGDSERITTIIYN